MTSYDDAFFEYLNAGSLRSAERVLPIVQQHLQAASVVDVGCGQGAWLSIWYKLGVDDITGVDGDYVERGRLLIPGERFTPFDLSRPLDLGRRFDLAMSLEVAEHLPATSAAGFVAGLVKLSDRVLFSAAPKGQGGDEHINEQNYEYWRQLFAAHGYAPVDFLRPQVIGDKEIEPWFRYNPVLYVAADALAALPAELTQYRVPDGVAIADLSPALYKLRKLMVRCLPVPLATKVAKMKEWMVVRSAPAASS